MLRHRNVATLALANSVRTLLELLPALGWHGIQHLLHVFHAVAPHLQREWRRLTHEAPVAAADGAGRDETMAFEAAIAHGEPLPDGIAPVDRQAVAQPRPVWQPDLFLQRPVERELAVEAHRAGGAFRLADVDEPVAAVGAQHRIARPVVIEGRPAENEGPIAMAACRVHRVFACDRHPGRARETVVVVWRSARGR